MAKKKKAILVRATNINYLSERFNATDEEKTPLRVGYFLIADFDSQDGDFDLLTPGVFNKDYHWTGQRLENGFLEVERRVVVDAPTP